MRQCDPYGHGEDGGNGVEGDAHTCPSRVLPVLGGKHHGVTGGGNAGHQSKAHQQFSSDAAQIAHPDRHGGEGNELNKQHKVVFLDLKDAAKLGGRQIGAQHHHGKGRIEVGKVIEGLINEMRQIYAEQKQRQSKYQTDGAGVYQQLKDVDAPALGAVHHGGAVGKAKEIEYKYHHRADKYARAAQHRLREGNAHIAHVAVHRSEFINAAVGGSVKEKVCQHHGKEVKEYRSDQRPAKELECLGGALQL